MWGLGYSRTDSRADTYGVDVRNWYLPVPIDDERFEILFATRIRKTPSDSSRVAAMVGRLGLEAARHLIMYEAAREFEKDIVIWNHAAYRERPSLCATDRDLLKFRSYCQQFYPDHRAKE